MFLLQHVEAINVRETVVKFVIAHTAHMMHPLGNSSFNSLKIGANER